MITIVVLGILLGKGVGGGGGVVGRGVKHMMRMLQRRCYNQSEDSVPTPAGFISLP